MAAERVLYWGSGSGPAWRVMVVLHEKGLKYDSKLIEFSKGGHKSAEIMAINPRGQVPTYSDHGVVVNESLAAVQYVDAVYPDPPLTPSPKDPKALGLVLQRFHETANLGGKLRDVIYPKMRDLIKTPEDEKDWQSKVEALKVELKLWESSVEGPFLCGSSFTIADIAFGPSLLSVLRFGATLDEFPKLKKYAEVLAKRPSFEETMPPHWRDTAGPTWCSGHM